MRLMRARKERCDVQKMKKRTKKRADFLAQANRLQRRRATTEERKERKQVSQGNQEGRERE